MGDAHLFCPIHSIKRAVFQIISAQLQLQFNLLMAAIYFSRTIWRLIEVNTIVEMTLDLDQLPPPSKAYKRINKKPLYIYTKPRNLSCDCLYKKTPRCDTIGLFWVSSRVCIVNIFLAIHQRPKRSRHLNLVRVINKIKTHFRLFRAAEDR